jgi:N-formylglutamate amidohydrolase
VSSVFNLIPPTAEEIPILISVPHCGVIIPSELKNEYKPELIGELDDTDWFVDRLYDFAPAMGITMITANYSRWVVDLNRDPQSKPLYTDGRVITALCTTTTFLGEPIYQDERKEVDPSEVARRVNEYYVPYHQAIEEQLTRLKNKFGKVLLWDCHSIRQTVLAIHKEKFPDLILGDADGTSALPELIDIAENSLQAQAYSFSHNYPFKGGYITRHYGKPSENIHALQLEMSKVNYMNDMERDYDSDRAHHVRLLLENTFTKLNQYLKT